MVVYVEVSFRARPSLCRTNLAKASLHCPRNTRVLKAACHNLPIYISATSIWMIADDSPVQRKRVAGSQNGGQEITKQVRKQEPTQKLELIDAEYEEDAFQDAGAMHDNDDADASEVSNDGSRPGDDVVDVQHFDRPVMEQAAQNSKALSRRSSSKSSGPGMKKKPAGKVEGMCCRGAVCACSEHMLSVRGPRVTWLELSAEEAHEICMLPLYLVSCVRILGSAAPDAQQKMSCSLLKPLQPGLRHHVSYMGRQLSCFALPIFP
jgi:hypothetical protein